MSFDDSANPSPGVYQAGDTFSLDLYLNFASGDLSTNPLEDVAGGVSFDLDFAAAGGSPDAGQAITLVSRDKSTSGFDSFNNFNDSFGPVSFFDGTGDDLGQFSFVDSFSAGQLFLATYEFQLSQLLPEGDYELSTNGFGVSAVVTSGSDPFDPVDVPLAPSAYRFQVVVPEPASVAWLVAGGGLMWRRRQA
ncbi:MAG: PEP-CTERM sorting domain-containing protein [Planctomycetota bacterium]